jgi:uncharacterized protein (TIGR04255 family)
MTTVARPPVNEVVISISFQPQPVLEGPRLLIGLSRILADFPQVTEVPPYGMPAEQPFEEQVLQPAVPQIQFVSSPQTQRRYWLTESESSSLLLQIQSNYFALNWRRQEGGEYYPGFERLTEIFQRYVSLFEEAVIGQGGETLTASQLELTYINILRPDELWGGTKDLHKVVNLNVPGMDRFEQLNLAYSEPVMTASGSFYGRLHAAVATGYQPKAEPAEFRPLSTTDLIPIINLSITTRSARLAESTASIGQRFDLAHDAVTEAFERLTTDVARRNWGLL